MPTTIKAPDTNAGLKQRITIARSGEDIDKLLALGDTYQTASESTKRSWLRAAKKRRYQLSSDIRS